MDKTFGHQKQFKITKPQISIRHSLVAQISFLDLYRPRIFFFCLSLAVYDTSLRRPPWPRFPLSLHRRYSPTFKPSLPGPLLLSASPSFLSPGFPSLPLGSALPLPPSPILYPRSHAHPFPPTPTSLPSPFSVPVPSPLVLANLVVTSLLHHLDFDSPPPILNGDPLLSVLFACFRPSVPT